MVIRADSDAFDTSDAPMLADMRRQGDVLAALLERDGEIAAFARQALTPDRAGRVYAFGSGDGWFAARAAAGGRPAFEGVSGLDFELRVVPTLTHADRTVAISMSGNVDRTVSAAEAVLKAGHRLCVLTNDRGGRLGALSTPVFRLGVPDVAPFLCGTSSYLATLAFLNAAFDLAGPDESVSTALRALTGELAGFVEGADQFAQEVAAGLQGRCPGIRILSTGSGLATADYGAAKFVELTRIPAWSDDIEEFAHRQYWTMDRGETVVLLPLEAGSAAASAATADALGDLGIRTIALEPAGAVVPTAVHRLALPGDALTASFTQAIALQALAYRYARATGTDPDRRPHLKQDTERFAVSRKLTRRSLVGTGA